MSGLGKLLRRLRRDERGTVLIEFAVAAPVVLTMGLVGLEMAHFGIAKLRVTQIAALTADSASRVRDRLDEADVDEIFEGAKMTGEKIGFAQNGRIILSSLEPNTAGAGGTSTGQWIRWQRCDGAKRVVATKVEGNGRTDNSIQALGPPGRQVAAMAGTAVNYVEVVYDYQPIVGNVVFQATRTIRETVAFNVRQRTDQSLSNNSSMTAAAIRTCDKFEP